MAIYYKRKSEVVKTKVKDFIELFVTAFLMGSGFATGLIIVTAISKLF